MSNELFSLKGQWAVVTGASKGLGAGMAVALAKAGANLILVARGNMDATTSAVEAAGGQCRSFQVDLGKRTETKQLLEDLADLPVYPSILVNNAGTIRRAELADFTEADWDEVLEINLSSIFILSQGVARQWLKDATQGRVINIASMLSYQGGIRVPSYTATKTGLVGLTRLMANELAPSGICVNAIAPGYMATDNTEPLRNDPKRNGEILARIPTGRWGTPEDLGGTVVFLASKASAYINGITLPVDGGWLSR